MALVVVSHGSTATLLERKAGLSPIKGLNLGLLINRQDERMLRRIEVQPDHVFQLLDKMRIVAELEGPHQMGLQTMPFPNPTHRRVAHSRRPCHTASTPVSGIAGGLLSRPANNLLDQLPRDRRQATRPRSIFLNPSQTQLRVSTTPAAHRMPHDPKLRSDLLVLLSRGCQQDNLGSLNQPGRSAAASRKALQLPLLLRRKPNFRRDSHPQILLLLDSTGETRLRFTKSVALD